MAKSIEKSMIVLALLAVLSHAEDLTASPSGLGNSPAVDPLVDPKAAPVPPGGAVPPPATAVGPNAPPGRSPVPDPLATAPQATGEAVTTETRHPDGSVVTVTRFNGQIPHHVMQQHYPGMWSPFQYGLHRPYYPY